MTTGASSTMGRMIAALLAQTAEEVTRAQPWQIRLTALETMLVIGLFLPLLVGLATKLDAHPGLKAMLLATATAVSALVTQAVVNDGVSVISKQAVVLAVIGWAAAVATHFGFWKPTGISGQLAPRSGLG